MSGGRIPIYRAAQPVGAVLWAGTLAAGRWRFVARRGSATAVEDRAAVRLAFDQRQDLARRHFTGPGDRTFRGWHGFPGVLAAFEASLPAVGLRAERSEAVWPTKRLIGGPRGALLGLWDAEAQADAAADAAARAAALRSFEARNRTEV